jgi:hypothetical protein
MSALLITGLKLFKEHVLTPRGRDMIPELGPVVTASPGSKLSYLGAGGKVILELVREGRGVFTPGLGCLVNKYCKKYNLRIT